MIPKLIHYIWLGSNDLSALNQKCIDSWEKKLPGYKICFWNEVEISNVFKEEELIFYHEMLNNKKYAFAADYVRCLVLEKYGGIYLDTDVEVLKDFSPLLNNSSFLGLEDINKPNCAILGSEKNSKFISDLKKEVERSKGLVEIQIVAFNVLIRVYKKDMNFVSPCIINDVAVYPEEFFYPYNPYKSNSIGQLLFSDVTSETYAIHHWAKTWNLTYMERLVRFIKRKFI